MAERPQTEWENLIVAEVVQALLGSITPNMKAISIEMGAGRDLVTVHFALETQTKEEQGEIEEFVEELDVLLGGETRIETDVWVGPEWWSSDWQGRSARLVYAAKAPGQAHPD